jgi:hypothetical protein
MPLQDMSMTSHNNPCAGINQFAGDAPLLDRRHPQEFVAPMKMNEYGVGFLAQRRRFRQRTFLLKPVQKHTRAWRDVRMCIVTHVIQQADAKALPLQHQRLGRLDLAAAGSQGPHPHFLEQPHGILEPGLQAIVHMIVSQQYNVQPEGLDGPSSMRQRGKTGDLSLVHAAIAPQGRFPVGDAKVAGSQPGCDGSEVLSKRRGVLRVAKRPVQTDVAKPLDDRSTIHECVSHSYLT